MSLIEIPPFVLSGDDPPASQARVFDRVAHGLVEPIEFPRELFADALAEHARLLEAHGTEIATAPLDRPDEEGDRFVHPELAHHHATLLVSDGGAHELHRWLAVELSYVVQRCRGIVRRLLERAPHGHGFVVVVSRQVASLHLVRASRPRRAGEPTTLEVVERDLVVEPWDQWHEREGQFSTTWWRTPAGDLAASRVPVRPRPRTLDEVVDVLLCLRGASLRARIAQHRRESPRSRPLGILETNARGEVLEVRDLHDADELSESFPEIGQGLRVAREGVVPVVVDGKSWAALCWMATDPSSDVAVPARLVVTYAKKASDDDEDDDEEEGKAAGPGRGAAPEPPLRLTDAERVRAFFDHFPPVEPWTPRASEVHAAWMATLTSAATLLLVAGAAILTIATFGGGALWRAGTFAFLVVTLLLARFFWLDARDTRRNLDPVRREHRWLAWKQVREKDGPEAPRRKPGPPVEGRKSWMKRLANRLARLERLVALDAPETIIRQERRLVRDAIAKLAPSDADAVLAAWPAGAKYLDPRGSRGAGKKSGDKPN